MPNLDPDTLKALADIFAALTSHAPPLGVCLLVIVLFNKMLTKGQVPIFLSVPLVWRGVIMIGLSSTAGMLDAIVHGQKVLAAVLAGVPVLLGALYSDADLLHWLAAKFPWIGPFLGNGGGGSNDVPPAPKAAPPGTFRSSLGTMARAAGIALAAFIVLASALSLASCAAFKQDTKTALNDVQIACIFEHAIGIDSMIPGQDAAILAGICHLDDSLIPLVATVLSEHRRAEAMEIARHAGDPAPCGSAR